MQSNAVNEESQVREVLDKYAEAIRTEEKDRILSHHSSNALFYDVLPPMKFESKKAYRDSWDQWQPVTTGDMTFKYEELAIEASEDRAFAHSFIRCGGTLKNGKTFEDVVRATFCLSKASGSWLIVHQHVSKPQGNKAAA